MVGPRLEVARVLIGRGLKTEPIKMLTRFLAQPVRNPYNYSVRALHLLVDCGTEQVRVREVAAHYLALGWVPALYFQEIVPLLQRSCVPDPLLRASVLEKFAQHDHFSTYLIRQWPNREVVYAAIDERQWGTELDRLDLREKIPPHATDFDVRTAQLKWLSALNLPHERIQPAMVLLAVRYDEERALQLTQAIIDRRTDPMARALVERSLASDETDGQGQ